jgi:hypothetical protein
MWFESRRRKKLCSLLVIAAEKLAAVQGPIWSSYDSGRDIANFVLECRNAIEQGTITVAQKKELWGIFPPTSDWDDVVGDVILGETVFQLLKHLYWEEIRASG